MAWTATRPPTPDWIPRWPASHSPPPVGPAYSPDEYGEAALAVETAATVEDLAGTIHAHPTLGEAIMEAALGMLGRPVHAR